MLKICLSFDYELFLGENDASYEDILFSPTRDLQYMLNEEGVYGTFFADVCSAIVHSHYGLTDYSDSMLKQIKSLTKDGHDIQLHIHPSWYKAELKDERLVPSHLGYRLHEFDTFEDIIREGVDYLNNNLQEINKDYKCIAFRAGGFAVQPERDIFKSLVTCGITIDSSIVPHMKNDLVNGFDFSNVPSLLNWWIDPELGLHHAAQSTIGCLYEVPVATLRPHLFKYFGLSRGQMSLPLSQLKGKYVSNPKEQSRKLNRIIQVYRRLFDYRYVSLDTRYYARVVEDMDYIYKKYDLEQNDGYVCLICHPKLADNYRVENIRSLIKELKKQPDRYEIVTMSDIHKMLSKRRLDKEL